MRDVRFEVSKLFQLAFGINSPVFMTEPFLKKASPILSYSDIQMLPDFSKTTATSWMGTPIVMDLTFEAGRYNQYADNGTLQTVELANFTLPPATMFSFRRAKNITRTNILGSNGTVKEIFGFDDWIIDVKGLCLDEPNRSAKEQLKELMNWERLADSIQVIGEEFSMLEIRAIAINEFSHNVLQGSSGGTIAYQMQLFSDDSKMMQLFKG